MSTTMMMMMMKKSFAAVIVGLQLLAVMMTITTTTNVFVSSFSLSQPLSQQRVVRQQLSQESRRSQSRSWRNSKLNVSNEEEEPESQDLIFGDAIESEMNAVKGGANEYDFGQIDYLALAKQRAANKPESNNNVAGDDEWMDLAKEKEEQFGKIDDWENSQKEAGNADSQSLLMFNTEQQSTEVDGGSEDGDDDEPK